MNVHDLLELAYTLFSYTHQAVTGHVEMRCLLIAQIHDCTHVLCRKPKAARNWKHAEIDVTNLSKAEALELILQIKPRYSLLDCLHYITVLDCTVNASR